MINYAKKLRFLLSNYSYYEWLINPSASLCIGLHSPFVTVYFITLCNVVPLFYQFFFPHLAILVFANFHANPIQAFLWVFLFNLTHFHHFLPAGSLAARAPTGQRDVPFPRHFFLPQRGEKAYSHLKRVSQTGISACPFGWVAFCLSFHLFSRRH